MPSQRSDDNHTPADTTQLTLRQLLSERAKRFLEEQQKQPYAIYNGAVIIRKGVSIKQEPSNSPFEVSWEKIESINGTVIKGVSEIVVDYPLLVRGANVSAMKESPGIWTPLEAEVETDPGQKTTSILFVSLGFDSIDIISLMQQYDERTIIPIEIKNEKYYDENGTEFPLSKIAKVSFVPKEKTE